MVVDVVREMEYFYLFFVSPLFSWIPLTSLFVSAVQVRIHAVECWQLSLPTIWFCALPFVDFLMVVCILLHYIYVRFRSQMQMSISKLKCSSTSMLNSNRNLLRMLMLLEVWKRKALNLPEGFWVCDVLHATKAVMKYHAAIYYNFNCLSLHRYLFRPPFLFKTPSVKITRCTLKHQLLGIISFEYTNLTMQTTFRCDF